MTIFLLFFFFFLIFPILQCLGASSTLYRWSDAAQHLPEPQPSGIAALCGQSEGSLLEPGLCPGGASPVRGKNEVEGGGDGEKRYFA